MSEPMFKNAKEGDTFYSLKHGYCTIKEIVDSRIIYPVFAMSCGRGDKLLYFTMDGYYQLGDKTRDAYWAKPEIIERVPKVVEGWVNIVSLYKSKQEALDARIANVYYCGEPHFIRHEYYD